MMVMMMMMMMMVIDLKCRAACDTTCGGTKLKTSHHRSPGGERRGQRKHSTTCLGRTREGHHQSDKHWNGFKGNTGETSERRDGANMGFSERVHTIPNRTALHH